MFTLWTDLDRAFFRDPLRALRTSEMGQLFDEFEQKLRRTHPRMKLEDLGEELRFTMELPGVALEDTDATVHNDVLTVRAQTKDRLPEGYRAHLSERENVNLQHSISLPVPVDPEKTTAVCKDGVLSIRLATAPESKPRQIAVTAG